MRNIAQLAIVLLFAASVLFIGSCKVDDINNPVITLNGDAVIYLQHGTAFTDPGYTANDTEDGDISSKVVVTGTVDANKARTFTLTYSVKDKAGNQDSVERKVIVRHTKNSVAGNFQSSEACDSGNNGPYNCSIAARAGNEFTIKLNNFGDYPAIVALDGEITGANGLSLVILTQMASGMAFSGSGTLNEAGSQIVISYAVFDGSIIDTCTGTWIKQ